MLRLFAGNIVFVLVFVPILVTINYVLEIMYGSYTFSEISPTNLWGFDFTSISNWTMPVVIVFTSLNAILINYTFNQHEFYDKNNFLPSLFYVLLACLFPYSISLSGELFAQTFIIIALNQLLKTKQNEDARAPIFNSGLATGVAATLNPIYLFFLAVVLITLARIRPFVFREYLLSIIGLIIPFAWLFLVNETFYTALFDFQISSLIGEYNHYMFVAINAMISILVFIALQKILVRSNKSTIRFKRIISIVFFILLFTILSNFVLIYSHNTYYYFTAGVFILCLVLPYAYLESKNKILASILIYGIVFINILKFIV